jgi:flagellar protein FliO/FliZ
MNREMTASTPRILAAGLRRMGAGLFLAAGLFGSVGSAQPAERPGGFAPGTVIYPQGAGPARTEPMPSTSGGSRAWLLVLAGALGAGGLWVLYRRRKAELGRVGGGRAIVVEETRSLGNRQYLVIAACDGRRFLLGVTPGRIELVAPLDERKSGEAP